MPKDKKLAVVWFLLFLVVIFAIGRLIPQEEIKKLVENAGAFGPAIFIGLTLLSLIVAPLSGSPILFIGFYLFGNKVILYSTIATYISFVTNFWISRTWGRLLVARFIGEGSIEKVDKLAKSYGLITLFFLRFFQGGVHDFISYAAGLTSIKFVPYFIVSLLGSIPGTLIWFYFSSLFSSPLTFTLFTLIFATTFSGIFIFATALIKGIKNKSFQKLPHLLNYKK